MTLDDLGHPALQMTNLLTHGGRLLDRPLATPGAQVQDTALRSDE